MYLIRFQNGKFLGVSINQSLVYAHNINFAYTFASIEKAEKAEKWIKLQLGETSYVITDLQGNSIN